MRFSKYHGAGNDFVVIDARELDVAWDALAARMCDRHFGVGSDGLILVLESRHADLRMRMFNPDGSEAEACGNGLRCFVKFAVDRGMVSCREFDVDTLSGIRHATTFTEENAGVTEAMVGMGVPRFLPEEIPALAPPSQGPIVRAELSAEGRAVSVCLVSMGNPHAVSFVAEDVAGFPLEQVGPAVEHHPMFPARVNFEIARVLGRHEIQCRVWERGAGETLACGSGACAVAAAAQLLGYCDAGVRVQLPGGVLTVSWEGGGHEVLLRGPVEHVFDGEWPD